MKKFLRLAISLTVIFCFLSVPQKIKGEGITFSSAAHRAFLRGTILETEYKYAEAFREYRRALKEIPEDSLRFRMETLFRLMDVAYRISDYLDALEYATDILTTEKPDSLLWTDVEAASMLNAISKQTEGYGRKEYQNIASEALSRLKGSVASDFRIRQATIRHLILQALYETDTHNREMAFRLYNRALEMNPPKHIANVIYNNIGDMYLLEEDTVLASKYFQKVLDSGVKGIALSAAVNNNTIILLGGNDPEGALRYMDANQSLLDYGRGSGELEAHIHLLRHFILMKLDRMPEAVAELYRAYSIIDSVHSPRNPIFSESMKEADRRVKEFYTARSLAKDRIRTQIVLIVVIIVAGLLLAGVVVLFVRNRKRRKEVLTLSEDLRDKHRHTSLLVDRLRDAETAYDTARKEMQTSAELESQQRTSLLIELEQCRRCLADISEIPEVRMARTGLAKNISEQLKKLDRSENIWNARRSSLESVNQSFFDLLHTRYPNLTNAERDMCAYALMNLTTKEIAAMTNRSIKTVNCIRHNLRKKLGIPTEEATEKYLRELSASVNANLQT